MSKYTYGSIYSESSSISSSSTILDSSRTDVLKRASSGVITSGCLRERRLIVEDVPIKLTCQFDIVGYSLTELRLWTSDSRIAELLRRKLCRWSIVWPSIYISTLWKTRNRSHHTISSLRSLIFFNDGKSNLFPTRIISFSS